MRLHERKRQALEQLKQFAVQLASAGDGMEALQFLARPSQTKGGKSFSFLDKMIEHLSAFDSEELQSRLAILNQVLIEGSEYFLTIADLSEHSDNDDSQLSVADLEALPEKLNEFKRKAQTNVALRLCLIDQGVQLTALKLPISQEELGGRLVELRNQERACKDKIKQEINHLLADTNQMIEFGGFPDALQEKMLEVKAQLQASLKHIDRGGSIDTLPMVIEVHAEPETVLPANFDHSAIKPPQAEPSSSVSSSSNAPQAPLEQPTMQEPPSIKPLGTWTTFKIWLSSPWGVKWGEIKQGHYRR